MALKEYHNKRNFKKTPEPKGKIFKASTQLTYVIQKHAASHLHYDFRIEMDGVLKSWAVPKGPSLNPADKRLAVHVEDHPLDYADFEGIIPAGQYGGGTVMVWDQGSWEPEGDPENDYKNGKLLFTLHGKKLQGQWTLFRMGGKAGANGKNWLLVKKPDKFAKVNYDIEVKQPLSAKTGRTMEQIANSDEIYHDNDEPEPAAAKIKFPKLVNAHKATFPDFIHPQLATLVTTPPAGDEWLHEIKFDGYRILSFIQTKKVRLMSRREQDWTDKFAAIATALENFPVKNTILDGELVVLDQKGVSRFQLLQNALENHGEAKLTYYVFDIPYYDNKNLANVPLIERKQILQQICKQWKSKPDSIVYSDHAQGNGNKMFEQACHMGLEGVVSKKIDSPYEQRRTHTWTKAKCLLQQEFVVGGFTSPGGARKYFGALLLGYYNADKQLIYCGKVGTGFNEITLKKIYTLLKTKQRQQCPFAVNPNLKHTHWVKPDLVVEIQFFEWTDDNRLRQPSFQGLRLDKLAKEVIMEKPHSISTTNKAQKKSRINKKDSTIIADVALTHPEKLFYDAPKVTKLDLANYYQKIAKYILPHLINRPLTLVRCPDSNFKQCFFQKHIQKHLPDSIYPIHIRGDKEPYLFIKNLSGLIALVQMDVLEIHPWGSKIDDPEKPDQLTFDIDPGTDVAWEDVINTALRIKKNLQAIGLASFVKTTGGKGLHVVVPFKPSISWKELTQFTKSVADYMVEQNPELYTATMSKTKRHRKIFIDYLRNARGATAVAAYSTRAREGAFIATPLSWSELKRIKSPQEFNLDNMLRRMQRLKQDPWKNFFKIKQEIIGIKTKK